MSRWIVKFVRLQTRSAFRRSRLATRNSSEYHEFGRRMISFVCDGACLSKTSRMPLLNTLTKCSTALFPEKSAVVNSISLPNSVSSMLRNFRNEMVLRWVEVADIWSEEKIPLWSAEEIPRESHKYSLSTRGTDCKIVLLSLVITTSRVWPRMCVGPVTCCLRPCSLSELRNFLARGSFGTSGWKFMSPVMRSSSVATTCVLRYCDQSSKNPEIDPLLFADGGRYTTHTRSFECFVMTEHSICSKCAESKSDLIGVTRILLLYMRATPPPFRVFRGTWYMSYPFGTSSLITILSTSLPSQVSVIAIISTRLDTIKSHIDSALFFTDRQFTE